MRMPSTVLACASIVVPALIVAAAPAGFAQGPEKHEAGHSKIDSRTPPSEEDLQSLRRECASDKYKFSYEKIACLKPYVQGMTMLRSTRESMRVAQGLKRDKIVESCHHLAHFIGEASLEKNGYDVGRSLASCTLDCIQG